MAEKQQSVYVVMRKSGKIMDIGGGLGGVRSSSPGGFFSILEQINTEMGGAGSDHDPPDKLFLNGKMVVEGRLDGLAYKYAKDKIDARSAADREVLNLHAPSWLPDREAPPGYNPPGIDIWKVEKVRG